jgi:hypothetical protein
MINISAKDISFELVEEQDKTDFIIKLRKLKNDIADKRGTLIDAKYQIAPDGNYTCLIIWKNKEL